MYSSIVLTDNGTHMDVYLTSPDPTAEAKLSSLAPAGDITFMHAPQTRAQLLAVHAKVMSNVASLQAQGIDVVSIFPGVNGDGLEHLGVVNVTPAQTATLDQLFGADSISVDDVAPSDVPVTTGRNTDSAPWKGGDNLTSNQLGCTSGTGINLNGQRYMITASHCYDTGWPVYNAFPYDDGPYMGSVYLNDWSQYGDDTALIGMATNGLIWTGVVGDPTVSIVSGWATNPDGAVVCNEGAYSGAVCSSVITNNVGCIQLYYDILGYNRWECNIVESKRESSPWIANQDGDSGGPMIRWIGGDLMVTGIVSAGAGPGACEYNTTHSNTCYNIAYYTAMDEILTNEYPGASLVLG